MLKGRPQNLCLKNESMSVVIDYMCTLNNTFADVHVIEIGKQVPIRIHLHVFENYN